MKRQLNRNLIQVESLFNAVEIPYKDVFFGYNQLYII